MELKKRMIEIHNKVDGVYNDLNAKIEHLSTHMKTLYNQIVHVASSSKRPIGTLSGKFKANPKKYCQAITLRREGELPSREPWVEEVRNGKEDEKPRGKENISKEPILVDDE